MIIKNNVRVDKAYKSLANRTAFIFIFLCSIPNMVCGQGENKDSLIQQAHLLDSLAEYNYDQGNDSIALALSKQSSFILERILGERHSDYAKTLCHVAKYLNELCVYEEAMDSIIKAINIQKISLGIKHPDYAESISTYADIFSSLGKYKSAIDLKTEALNIYKEACGADSKQYVNTLVELASFNYEIGNIQKSISMYEQVLSIYNENKLERNTSEYAKLLLEYSKSKSAIGHNQEAIKICKEARIIYKILYGEKHLLYAVALNCLAYFYSEVYNFEESARLNQIALEIFKEKCGVINLYYATTLRNLAQDYCSLGDIDKALSFAYDAKDIFESLFGPKDQNYIYSLSHIADYYAQQGQKERSIEIAKKALDIVNDGYEGDYYADVSLLYDLAECYYHLDDYYTALSLGQKALNKQKEFFTSDNVTYVKIIENLSYYYAKLGLYDKAINCKKESIHIATNKVMNNFSESSFSQSQFLWKGLQYSFIDYAALFYRQQDSMLLPDLYDKSALFAKALLLNVDMEIRKVISESKDSALIHNYLELSSNRDILNKLTELPMEEHFLNIDSLREIIQEQDEKLIQMSKEYGDYIRNLKLTWKDVQNNLKEKDVAIEFLDFPIGTDSIMYIALTVRKDSELPKMTVLFEEKQLKQIPDTLYYQCKEMTDLVWGALLPEVQGIKNIYFSPSGALHKICIEYLPGMEKYNLYRLSSTRELVTRKKKQSEDSAVLYGGLNYYARIDTIGNDKSKSILDNKYVEHANVRGMKLRGGKEYLPHTKEEVEQIATELRNAKWICQLDTLDKGTEESFKSLSGKKVNTLHISTHGFYFTPDEADKMNYDFLRLDNRMASTEDKALTRSGLIMSGANHILEGEELPDNVEDGILTAKEIADVDLRGLDLVVLSACQTGLGDISQGEGVFGLQRGFKKAGAKTILMSLWEVDDKATQILMTQFYKNLLAGQSKRQSLLSAQEYLRVAENGKYNDPKYWASFIMLDGVN